MSEESLHRRRMAEIVGSYEDRIVRAYSRVRFQILRQRFLEEIGQYLPVEGEILDVGCGFGLFALYFSMEEPGRRIQGLDLDARRIEMARLAARRLGISTVRFELGRAEELSLDPSTSFDAVYMLDVVHHLPPAEVEPLLRSLVDSLSEQGTLVIKDVDTRPAFKRVFTHVLDLLVDPRHPPHYWSKEELTGLLGRIGLQVYRHAIVDYLPYPHMLYVCRKGLGPRGGVGQRSDPSAR